MKRGQALRLPDAAGYAIWLLCVGSLDFAAGSIVPHRPVTICVNALLLRGHGQTLLVDAGSGPADPIWPGADGLDEALATVGLDSDEIDAVVLTHLDFDHAGGALAGKWPDGCRPAFAHAVMSGVDYRVQRPGEREDQDVGTRLVDAYEAAGSLELVEDGAEFRPGLRLLSAPGHRPGHCVLLAGDELVFGADLVHSEEHIEHPEWDASMDADPELALATRRRWIGQLLETGTPAAFSHVARRGRVVPGPSWQAD